MANGAEGMRQARPAGDDVEGVVPQVPERCRSRAVVRSRAVAERRRVPQLQLGQYPDGQDPEVPALQVPRLPEVLLGQDRDAHAEFKSRTPGLSDGAV